MVAVLGFQSPDRTQTFDTDPIVELLHREQYAHNLDFLPEAGPRTVPGASDLLVSRGVCDQKRVPEEHSPIIVMAFPRQQEDGEEWMEISFYGSNGTNQTVRALDQSVEIDIVWFDVGIGSFVGVVAGQQ
ncbi:hypothetical protein [Parvularcula oceani]|uniref:hypothetical protein n=1 Tax=Parvularcula oceani TaxID=1247963 RepID=UPI00138DFA6F|nr:hypothetical protein [Parvularcula oceani]